MGGCGGHDAKCPWPDLPWKSSGGKTLGVCDDSMLRQCDVAWPSTTVSLAAGAPQVNMNWVVDDVGFTELQPVALKFSTVPEDGLDREEFDRLVGMSALRYTNTNFLPQTETTLVIQPISHFGPYCTKALRITELGMIKAGANAPVAVMDLIATGFAGTALTTGTLFGRSIRGSMGGDYRPEP